MDRRAAVLSAKIGAHDGHEDQGWQIPLTQLSVMQSPLTTQICPGLQLLGQLEPPQSSSVSTLILDAVEACRLITRDGTLAESGLVETLWDGALDGRHHVPVVAIVVTRNRERVNLDGSEELPSS